MIDVCLILEGTYPYVAGGVATWVHQLVSAMRDLRFGIVYIAPQSDPTRRAKYSIPPHVMFLREIYLHDYVVEPTRRRDPTPADFALLEAWYDDLAHARFDRFPEVVRAFQGDARCFDIPTLFGHRASWELLCRWHARTAPTVSFLDFFWTWRATHLPLVQVMTAAIPPARIYHAVSTGYAGWFAAMAKLHHHGAMLLTEHGIYSYERLLEISQAQWIYEEAGPQVRAARQLSFFKQWWVQLFHVLSGVAYAQADQIFTLYEGNKTQQVLSGAAADKIAIIPNGIDLDRLLLVTRARAATPHIGLVGRVVAIKDVKTYIQAAKRVLETLPAAHFYIIGPADEEPDYAEECRRLVRLARLEERVTFTGRVDPLEYYRFLDLVVLTSVSEAQPYVILEANGVGIPIVATDVGACREMLEGRGAEDRALGASGLLTELANPDATATAITTLLRDRALYDRCAEAGKLRVRRYYDQTDLLSRYLNWYERYL